MSWNSRNKKERIFITFILSEGNVFNMCVLCCIVYRMNSQNIYTFTYKKNVTSYTFVLLFKITKALSVSLIITLSLTCKEIFFAWCRLSWYSFRLSLGAEIIFSNLFILVMFTMLWIHGMGNFTFRLNMIRRRYFSYCRGQLR